LSSRRR